MKKSRTDQKAWDSAPPFKNYGGEKQDEGVYRDIFIAKKIKPITSQSHASHIKKIDIL